MGEHRALNAILEPGGITSVFQPIIDVEDADRLVGFECLSRGPKGTNLESAKVLFEYVRLKREETLVDRACVAVALANAPKGDALRLTLNVHASTLARDRGFADFLCSTAATNGHECDRLTIEIIEHAPPWSSLAFSDAVNELRRRGMHIALDDVGLGSSNFKMILDVRPEIMKLDRYFVQSCDSDPDRQAVIAAITSLATHFGAEVIAEGVDSKAIADTLRRYGVRYMQGFMYSEPLTAAAARELVARGARIEE